MTELNIRLTGAVSALAGPLILAGGVLHVVLGLPGGHWLMLAGDIALLFALTGIYAVQAQRTGPAGLLGYVLSALGTLVIIALDFIVLAETHGVEAAHDVWMYLYIDANLVLPGTYALLLGLLVFGLSSAYGRVLPRAAGILLAMAAVANLPAVLLPGMTPAYTASLALLAGGLAWIGIFLLAGAARLSSAEPAAQIEPA